MSGTVVLRAVIFEPEELGAAEAAARGSGLDNWLSPRGGGGETRVRLRVLRPRRIGFLVQYPPSPEPVAVWEPVLALRRVHAVRLCRYHEGPRGEPMRHRYCTRLAVTRDGYCRPHSRSWKALYEKCAQGVDAACREAERLLPGGEEYTIYALDYGGTRLKIGLTQSWRLLWRLAEQPHVSAAAVETHGSLVEAREREKQLGRSRAATEGAGARLRDRLRQAARMLTGYAPEAAAARLAEMLHRLGMRGSYQAYTILPRRGAAWLSTATPSDEPPGPGRYRVLDYWGGLLLLEETTTRRSIVVAKHSLLHYMLDAEVAEADSQGHSTAPAT